MFLNYINAFRAVGIIFIVAGHSINAFDWGDHTGVHDQIKLLVANGSVFFVFIAGYLFQHLSPKYSHQRYMLSKLKYIVLPYILTSIPAIVYLVTFQRTDNVPATFYDMAVWQQVITFYLVGNHLVPMWFIPMIILFYLVAPVLIKLDQNKWFYYMLPVYFLLSYHFGRGLVYHSFIHFFSIYVFGMWCSKNKHWLNALLEKKFVVYGLLFLFLLVYVIEYVHYVLQSGFTLTPITTLQKLILTLLILGVLVHFNSRLENRTIDLIANYSFGIYFFHTYVLFVIKIATRKYEHLFNIDYVWFSYLVVVLIALGLSVIGIWLVKRFFKQNSRYIVGS